MLFVKMFMEFDVLLALFVLFEILFPVVRGRGVFPISRWFLRRIKILPPAPSMSDKKVVAAGQRLHDAEARLEAAKTELKAAQLERDAAHIEEASKN